MKLVHAFITIFAIILVASVAAALLTGCSVTLGPDGSKSVTVDSSVVPAVVKIIAEK